jgi:hypothetical protein
MNDENVWTTSKPIMLILTALVTWAISFVLFIVGLQFAQPVIIWGKDITVLVSAGISFVITMIELSFNDAIVDDEKDIVMLIIGGAAYALGLVVGYVALTSLLGLGDPRLEKVVAGSLSAIFEIAPERLMVMGLRRLGFSWSDITRGLGSRLGRIRMPSFNNSNRNQNTRTTLNNNNRKQPVTQSPSYREAINAQPVRTPKVPRPGQTNPIYDPATYHTLGGRQQPVDQADYEEQE